MILRQKLKYLRKQRGMSQLEIAEKLKVSRQAVSGWEAGSSKPSTENLQCMSKLYSVSLEYLLDDSQEFPKKKEDQGAERDIITDKSRNTKKAYILIVVGVLAFLLICFVWSSFNSDKENAKGVELGDMDGGVMPETEKEFGLTWED
ncbi:helix-turn-helix transcriptional regulator [uncultured Subdoligranulum sp.]|uniref:helix-turn-helix domain-containing protein n=1 Tax=uncultured Subdoligranulum sp. TaxID=512298 RepID=UPI0026175058|nr:helix-turn-helix transcriptional regulator [uncultured Subdoligranulum sp.]